jgi:hypothetical protein
MAQECDGRLQIEDCRFACKSAIFNLQSAIVLILLLPTLARSANDRPVPPVGMHGQLTDVVLPGPELEVKPLADSQAPFVLRITQVQPHGTAFRYDFEYYALEPGTYDLTRYLRTKDGSPMGKLPPLSVEVKGLLGPGLIHPHALEPAQTSWWLRYRVVLIVAAVLWVVGLLVILLWGRRRKRAGAQQAAGPATVADQLRPLVVRAMTGMLSAQQLAELERTLLAFWRHRLGLEKEKAPEALAKMRQHPEAGPLLHQLELWLHRPGTAGQVDVGKLLWPYQLAPADQGGALKPVGDADGGTL